MGKHRAPKGAKQQAPEVPAPRKPEKRTASRAAAALETFNRRKNDPKYARPYLRVYQGKITEDEADAEILAMEAVDRAREIERTEGNR